MEYTAEITIQTRHPLTTDAMMEVAEIGGVATGHVGGRLLSTTLTARGRDVQEATADAIDRVLSRIAGTVVSAETMTTAEADRRSAEQPKLVGVSEIAGMLGVSRQRVSMLTRREDFPRPMAQLASGPVWRAGDLSTFAAGWHRKPGRPKKTLDIRQ